MKNLPAFCAVLFLGAASGWAQTTPLDPQHRQHTRPPYSGPRKGQGQVHAKVHKPHGASKGHLPQPKADHVLAR